MIETGFPVHINGAFALETPTRSIGVTSQSRPAPPPSPSSGRGDTGGGGGGGGGTVDATTRALDEAWNEALLAATLDDLYLDLIVAAKGDILAANGQGGGRGRGSGSRGRGASQSSAGSAAGVATGGDVARGGDDTEGGKDSGESFDFTGLRHLYRYWPLRSDLRRPFNHLAVLLPDTIVRLTKQPLFLTANGSMLELSKAFFPCPGMSRSAQAFATKHFGLFDVRIPSFLPSFLQYFLQYFLSSSVSMFKYYRDL